MTDEIAILQRTYAAFNARQLDAVIDTLHPDVDWPNGWEGGRLYGRPAVRDYWTRQWAAINPSVEPVGFQPDEAGSIVVDVHQIVRDLIGNVVVDGRVQHVYQFEDRLIKRMDIVPISDPASPSSN